MSDVQLDADAFCSRLKLLYASWKERRLELWRGATSLAIFVGGRLESVMYMKSLALHMWLFGYEVPDVAMVFTEAELHILATQKKVQLFQKLANPCTERVGVKMVFHTKPKGEDGSAQVADLMAAIKACEPSVVGCLPKEQHEGKLAERWAEAFGEVKENAVDVSAGLGALMALKDDEEVKKVKKAAFLAAKVMKDFVVPKVEGIINEEKSVKHSKLQERTEEVIQEPQKAGIKLRAENCDIAFTPTFQSGGKYSLRLGEPSNSDILKDDVILIALGTKYSNYPAHIARCFLIDPSKSMEEEYAALLAAQDAAVASLKEGVELKAAKAAAVRVLQEKGQGHLVAKLQKNVGFGMGLELRDSALVLHDSNEAVAKPGMVFSVHVAVSKLEWPDAPNGRSKNYALQIGDTVVVQAGGKPPEVLTGACSKTWSDVAYYLKDDEEEGEEDALAPSPPAILEEGSRRRTRTEDPGYGSKEAQRKEIQDSLLAIKNRETYQRLTAGKDGPAEGASTSGRRVSEIQAYRSPAALPHARDLAVMVDQPNESVLLPILGVMVPFHILTIKNISSHTDGDHAYVRINFNFGGNYEPAMKMPHSIFLKELSFRSSDVRHASKVVQEMKVLRSTIVQREKERAERATLVEQEKLIKTKRVIRLSDLWIRPNFGGRGRKATGTLEAHQNGFRYSNFKGEQLDIMYRNIRFAFFQPAENEMITLVHFHLHNPIMVGKKKTKDVQFYTEVMDVVQTLDGNRRSMYDPDEIEEEQRERDRCIKVNREFQTFVKRVQESWEQNYHDLHLEFDIPFRDLGFNGVPHKSTAFLMPTVNCLVELIEMPFTVIALEDIEIVNLERVGFNLKNFDMAIVFKDFSREVFHIDAIPSQSLDTIKEWLTSVEKKYYESKMNLAWKPILKDIMEDPQGFFDNGGWNFLDIDASDSDEHESDAASEFQPDGDEEEASADYDSSETEASLVDSDEVVTEDSDDSDGGGEEAEGLTWEELEEEAKRQDRQKGEFSDSEDDAKKKRKKSSAGGNVAKRPRK
ncbi:unnamed protein product [Ostreobium quekettii]|uniref:FACT complex subunit n=1 Tax=Ostreobium quekettii TaxID=121088 RepID=A0A8S1J6S4_9CHLO|nr:unnamed protein product [Ostreobium quekettii]|eukprot:evm.model.scf_902.2 EVM.evm.TU.scf_902.2   scf_902:18841-33109(-)